MPILSSLSDAKSKVGAVTTSAKSKVDSVKKTVASKTGALGGLKGKASGLVDTVKSKAGAALTTTMGSSDMMGYSSYGGGEVETRTEYDGERLENYLFGIEIEGIDSAYFEECSGLEVVNSVIELNEGGRNSGPIKFYDRTHFSNIVLRHGVTNDVQIFEWLMNFVNDPEMQDKRPLAIVIKTLDGLEINRVTLLGAMPVRWSIPKLQANSGYPVEYIEFSVEGAIMGNEGADS